MNIIEEKEDKTGRYGTDRASVGRACQQRLCRRSMLIDLNALASSDLLLPHLVLLISFKDSPETEILYKEARIDVINVRKWMKILRSGETSLDDKPRSGRPSTATNSENVDKNGIISAYLSVEVIQKGDANCLLRHTRCNTNWISIRSSRYLLTLPKRKEAIRKKIQRFILNPSGYILTMHGLLSDFRNSQTKGLITGSTAPTQPSSSTLCDLYLFSSNEKV
ncbi:hypothetical protein LAZ67_1001530 [Cordylochernes scorpioides]|uniref:Uncharacterized protein n=1 Tax=Cordylochernes scorpioides TaxID=51811 RepID=A0ABY6JWA0_9ARAC|nr:hypothetical protein LAZ67_1001530 [Cordylochernes scorpioides]